MENKNIAENEFVESLNLVLKVVANGAPALANELTGVVRKLYNERNEFKQQVETLTAHVQALEDPNIEVPDIDVKKSK